MGCTMKSKSRQILKSALSRVENGTAISISFGATLRTNEKSKDRKIETHIALSQKNETETVEEGKTHITLKSIIESPMLRKPYEVEIEASTVLRRPISKWSREELMKEDLTSKLMVVGLYGSRGEERKTIKSTLLLLKSKEQEYFIRESPEYEECSRDESEGRLLSGLVSGNGKKVEISNIRLGNYFARVLPISTRYSLTTTILQKLTNYTTPSTCTIESGK